MTLKCTLTPVDTWFFREARSHDAVGVGQLNTLFPPPASTVAGALRTLLGDLLGINWQEFKEGQGKHQDLLGDGEHLGSFSLSSLRLFVDGQPVYPAPQDLLRHSNVSEQGGRAEYYRLTIGKPLRCDLGYVRLPEMNAPAGSKPLDNHYITEDGLNTWLAGEVPDASTLIAQSELFVIESRLGIGRDNALATVKEGLLYQTRHLRPTGRQWHLEALIEGFDEALLNQLPAASSIRLGGEGREAAVTFEAIGPLTLAPKMKACDTAQGMTLLLTSPARFNPETELSWCLPGFQPIQNAEGLTTHWEGQLAGVSLKLLAAVLPRPLRLGGWDQKKRTPKALASLNAPGSIYYCQKLDGTAPSLQEATAIQAQALGEDTAWGYGRLRVGWWV
jgi:CRISPR-associated protein Cmr3